MEDNNTRARRIKLISDSLLWGATYSLAPTPSGAVLTSRVLY